jgi:hypothetical protein
MPARLRASSRARDGRAWHPRRVPARHERAKLPRADKRGRRQVFIGQPAGLRVDIFPGPTKESKSSETGAWIHARRAALRILRMWREHCATGGRWPAPALLLVRAQGRGTQAAQRRPHHERHGPSATPAAGVGHRPLLDQERSQVVPFPGRGSSPWRMRRTGRSCRAVPTFRLSAGGSADGEMQAERVRHPCCARRADPERSGGRHRRLEEQP